MQKLMELFAFPYRSFESIHVAGTNGKGSTCAFLENIYRQAGYRTGLFTSPHLVHVEERIKINGSPIERFVLWQYCTHLQKMLKAANLPLPTFFEFLTCLAFLYFRDQKVEIAIVEVGLGGRLDATNSLEKPLASVITSIGLDHTELLGQDIISIAKEKGGIIKSHVPVILGNMPRAAERTLMDIARTKQTSVYTLREYFHYQSLPIVSLAGVHQRLNGGLAQLTAAVLQRKYPLTSATIAKSLQQTRCPGRWQKIEAINNNLWILDNTHNSTGVPFLKAQLNVLLKTEKRPLIFILGFTELQRAQAILSLIKNYGKKIFLFPLETPHAFNPEKLQPFLENEGMVVDLNTKPFGKEAFLKLYHQMHTTCFIVVGSNYLVGNVLENFYQIGIDPLRV